MTVARAWIDGLFEDGQAGLGDIEEALGAKFPQRGQAWVGERGVDRPAIAASDHRIEAVDLRQQQPGRDVGGAAGGGLRLVLASPGEAMLRPPSRRRTPLHVRGSHFGEDQRGAVGDTDRHGRLPGEQETKAQMRCAACTKAAALPKAGRRQTADARCQMAGRRRAARKAPRSPRRARGG